MQFRIDLSSTYKTIRNSVWLLLFSALLQPVIGILAATHPTYSVILLAAILLPPLILRVPFEWLFVALLFLGSGIFPYTYFPELVRFGGTGLYPGDVLLLILVLRMFIVDWPRFRNPLTVSPVTVPILLFFAAIAVSVAVSVVGGTGSFHQGGIAFRFESLFLAVPILLFGLRDMRQVRRLLTSLLLLTGVIAAMYVLQYVLGPRVSLFPNAKITVNAFEEAQGQLRNYAGGLYYVAGILIASIMIMQKTSHTQKSLYFLVAILAFAQAALSFIRVVWYGTLAGFAVMWLLGRRRERAGYPVLFGVMAAAFALCVMFISSITGAGSGNLLGVLVARVVSPVTGTVKTIAPRIAETDVAWRAFTQSPLVGVGASGPLGYTPTFDPVAGINRLVPTYFLHDGYVWLLAYFGVIGTLPLLLAFALGVWRALRASVRVTATSRRALLLALGAGMVSLLIYSITSNCFYDPPGELTLATLLGVSEAIQRIPDDDDPFERV
jgi:O-antigen ligase